MTNQRRQDARERFEEYAQKIVGLAQRQIEGGHLDGREKDSLNDIQAVEHALEGFEWRAAELAKAPDWGNFGESTSDHYFDCLVGLAQCLSVISSRCTITSSAEKFIRKTNTTKGRDENIAKSMERHAKIKDAIIKSLKGKPFEPTRTFAKSLIKDVKRITMLQRGCGEIAIYKVLVAMSNEPREIPPS